MGQYSFKLIALLAVGVLLTACQTVPTTIALPGAVPMPTASLGPQLEDSSTLRVPASSPMPVGFEGAPAPAGFLSFCLRRPDQCTESDKTADDVVLTAAAWTRISAVNQAINASIKPEDDLEHYGRAEYWNIPTDGRGDCDDYALAKRAALISEGFPREALRVAVVQTWQGDRHAVLTVTTDKGDYVLDNLRADIRPWKDAGYTWVQRQDPAKAWAWVAFNQTGAFDLVPTARN